MTAEKKNWSGPGRPSKADAHRRHEAILDLALEQFMSLGYRTTTMDGIAAAFGGSKATIYRQYGGKAQLLCAAMERGIPLLVDRLSSVPVARHRPMKDVLRDYALIIQAYHDDPGIRSLWQAVSEAKNELVDMLEDFHSQERRALLPVADYLRSLERDGRASIGDGQIAAACFSSLVSGGVSNFLAFTPRARDAKHLELALNLFVEGISPRSDHNHDDLSSD